MPALASPAAASPPASLRPKKSVAGLEGGDVPMGIENPDIRFVVHYQFGTRWRATTRKSVAPAATASLTEESHASQSTVYLRS